MSDENLEQEDIKEFVDKLNDAEIDRLREHCVKEIKDCSFPLPDEVLELMKANKEEKETKKKKSLWEVFCSALGDEYEGHEEIWNSLTLDEKRNSISTALLTWTDLMLLGLGSWFTNQVVPAPREKKSVKDVFVKDADSFKFKPSFMKEGAEFIGANKYPDNKTINLFFKVPGSIRLKLERLPYEAFNVEGMPDVIIKDEDLIKYIKEIPI